ncbi:MAG: pyridoxamine 5'-phosphate oxidase family protein [Anaerolineaceae bacterium]|nr:pyridoxamine 5'-phosphate oxidase family protein [Anaerolineaceae bacterium]
MNSEENKVKEKCIALLQSENQCHIGLCLGDDPYIVPISYGYRNEVLYFHSSLNGKKINILKENPKTSFSVEKGGNLVPAEKACKFSIHYASVLGSGKMEFVESIEEKREALDIISLQQGSPG